MKLPGWHGGGMSHKILYVMVSVALVVFALFYTVGYSHPYADNPDFIEPQLTDVVIILAAAICLSAIAVTAWAIFAAVRKRGTAKKMEHGINVTLISYVVAAFTLILLLVAFAMGSSEAISVNGKQYSENFTLRGADMFVLSSIVMIIMAAAAVAWGTFKSHLNK